MSEIMSSASGEKESWLWAVVASVPLECLLDMAESFDKGFG